MSREHRPGGQRVFYICRWPLVLVPGVTIAINMWWEPGSLSSEGGRRQLHGYPFYYLRQSMCEALVTMMDQIVAELQPLDLLPLTKAAVLPRSPYLGQMGAELHPGAGVTGAELRPLEQYLSAGAPSEDCRVDAAARLFVAIVTSLQQSCAGGLIRPTEGPAGTSRDVAPEETGCGRKGAFPSHPAANKGTEGTGGSRQGALPSNLAAASPKGVMGDCDLLARLISMLSCRELAAVLYQVACASPGIIRMLFFGEATAAATAVSDDAPDGSRDPDCVQSCGPLLTPVVAYLITSRLEQLEPGSGLEDVGGQRAGARERADIEADGSHLAGKQVGLQDADLPSSGELRGSGGQRPACCSEGADELHLSDAALISLLYPALYGSTGDPDKVS